MVNEQQQLMKQAAVAIEQLNERTKELECENSQLLEKVAKYERKDVAFEVASEMASRGLIEDDEIVKTAEKLVTEGKDLDLVKEALSTVESFFELGKLHDDSDNASVRDKVDPLTELLLGYV